VSGIIMREARFPGRAAIEAYGNGGFRFAGMSHQGSLMCLPDSMLAWSPSSASALMLDDFASALAMSAGIEVMLIGTGRDMLPLPKGLMAALREAGLKSDVMSTGAAVRTYNVLVDEHRRAAAALIAV
jgi:uncharacterized protein